MTPPVPTQTPDSPAAGVASWYVPGPTDAIGDRLVMFDNTGTPPLELLRIHRHVAAIPGFDEALRERVAELREFRHPAFAAVRAVQHLDEDGTLAVVAEHRAGQRLSELFQQQPRVPLQPAVVAWLLRELTAALAALQAASPGSFHGALTPDRIVLTPEGRLCILEHALGPALARAAQNAAAGRSAPPPGAEPGVGHPPDARSDVVQLAAIAVSMLVARPVAPAEVQSRLPALLDEVVAADAAHLPHMAPLRRWFELATSAQGGYRDAADAYAAARQLPRASTTQGTASAEAAREADTPVPVSAPASEAAASSATRSAVSRREPAWRPPRPAPSSIEELMREPFPSEAVPAGDARRAASSNRPASPTSDGSAFHTREQHPVPAADRSASERRPAAARRRRSEKGSGTGNGRAASRLSGRALFLALLVAAVVAQSLVIAVLLRRAPAAPAGAILIESGAAGDRVIVDGEEAGITPLQLEVGAGTHSVRVVRKTGR